MFLTVRSRLTHLALAALLLIQASASWAGLKFYRVLQGPNPGPAQAEIDRFIYGAEILYTGDAKAGQPTRVDGIVWHSDLTEAQYFVGTRNPVIEQREILERIASDKWEEAKILMQAIPDAYPRTENIADVIREIGADPRLSQAAKLELLSKTLHESYPDGFFLKPVAGFSSDGTFPSEKTDFEQVYEAYLRDVKPLIERRLKETGGDADTVHLESKRLPNYSGRVLEELLAHPDRVIVQAKINPAIGAVLHTDKGAKPLISEFRVHVVEGKVLKGGTETRWEDTRGVSPESYAEVEAFVERVVSMLPEKMRRMCFGMDVMKTTDGRYMVIELNAGGDSGYLYADTDVWIANLLAARYNGSTPLLDEFDRFARQPTLDAKEAALSKLLKRPELAALKEEVLPLTELLTHAKDVLLEDLKKLPNSDNAFDALVAIKRFRLEPYLRTGEIQLIANLLHDPHAIHAPKTLEVLGKHLGLQEGEILFINVDGEVRLANDLSYSDTDVEDLLLSRLKQRLDGRRFSSAKAKAEARDLVDDLVATRADLEHGKIERESLVRDLTSRLARGQADRIYYGGTRSALVRMLLERLAVR